MTTSLERFIACMEYQPGVQRPNHELGVWPQTRERWHTEAPQAIASFTWDWFVGEPAIRLDHREYVPVNYDFMPPFEPEVLEENEEYIVARNTKGIVSRALKQGSLHGARMCMDQYLAFPLERPEDWPGIKKRLEAAIPQRYPFDQQGEAKRWQERDYPLVLGRNCAANGFYWRAREFMGTEALSTAFYEYPLLMHDIMEFYADFIIETSRPVLDHITPEYFSFNEDFAMKTGPLLSPDIYREFIQPRLRRITEFMHGKGVRYVAVDSDGDPTLLVPLMMDAGVDVLWPLERASGVDPVRIRKQFGKSLRLWGGVDKRVLTQGRQAIREHLDTLLPLIEEGGYIPTIDHTVPPDVTWDAFRWYMDMKIDLLTRA